MDEMVSKIKRLLGITDNLQDSVLNTIVENTVSRLAFLIGQDDVPAELQYIVIEVSIIRFNRLGSEGYASDSLEGHTITFVSSDFADYTDDINTYLNRGKSTIRGRVVLL